MLHRRLRYVSTALVASGIGSVLHPLKMKDFLEKSGSNLPRQAKPWADSPITEEPRGIDDTLLIDAGEFRYSGNPKVHRSKTVGQIPVGNQLNLGRQVRPLQWRFAVKLAFQVSDGQRDIFRP